VAPYGSFVLGLNLPITPIANPIPGNSIAGGATLTISPTMTNEFKWGFTHNSILITESGNALTATASGVNLLELYPNAVQDNYIPKVTFNGTRISWQLQFRRQPQQSFWQRVRLLERPGGRLQLVHIGHQPHQRAVPLLGLRTVYPGHPEDHVSPDTGLWPARRMVPAAI
jgi:hypothetical protein